MRRFLPGYIILRYIITHVAGAPIGTRDGVLKTFRRRGCQWRRKVATASPGEVCGPSYEGLEFPGSAARRARRSVILAFGLRLNTGQNE